MRFPIRSLAAAAVVTAAGLASAHGVSGRTEPLEDAADTARQAVLADAARAKVASKVLKFLAKPSNERSLADEIRSVAAASKLAETKLSDQTALADAFSAAAAGYLIDLRSSRTALELAASSPQVKASLRRKYEKALAKFDRKLPLAVGKAPETPTASTLATYAAAAAQVKGFTPYDSGTQADWVLSSLTTAPKNTGVDLTGDGKPDNQFAAIQALLALFGGGTLNVDDLFAGALGEGGTFAVIRMWYLQDLAKGDPFVLAGLYGGTDADGNAANDFSGSGSFAPTAESLGDDGQPLVRVGTSVAKGGSYRIDFTGQALALGGFTVPEGTQIIVQGVASQTSNDGYFGFAIPTTAVIELLTAQGIDVSAYAAALSALADVDADGNGSKDSISVSLAFESVTAVVAAPAKN